jgi:hypothetical protein
MYGDAVIKSLSGLIIALILGAMGYAVAIGLINLSRIGV